MSTPGYFDIKALRRRVVMHEMHERGFRTEEIATKLQVGKRFVQYWLKRSKPRLRRISNDVSWRDYAACNHHDTALFFPETQGRGSVRLKAQAKKICASCPVREQCRRAALEFYETTGVWGGEDMSQYRYRYDEETGDVYVEIGGKGAALQKIS